jgi:hypothetical protein
MEDLAPNRRQLFARVGPGYAANWTAHSDVGTPSSVGTPIAAPKEKQA